MSDIRIWMADSVDTRSQCCPRVQVGATCFNTNCKYSHRKEDAPICKMWQRGFCIGGRGNNCPLRHYYNERDESLQQSKRFQETWISSSEHMDFSSPYRVKVLKEIEEQRCEEVDLDTGRRRSWVEKKEVEIFDLTGDTPMKPPPPRSPLKSKNLIANLAAEIKKSSDLNQNLDKRRTRTRSSSMPPPSSPKPALDSRICPMCKRTFKSERGVKQHRAKAVNCGFGIDKENEEAPSESNVSPRVSLSLEDSVVVIDTPPPSDRRRSIRISKIKKK